MHTLGIVAFVVTLFVMVIFHEFGHFITARKFGIKVDEFFIGFGPRIFSRRKGETEFGLKAILLGGYVRIAGMNPFEQISDEDRPRTFGAKPAWQRAVVLVAGSFTHFVLATVILTLLFSAVGLHDSAKPLARVDSVSRKISGKPGPALSAGLKQGDRILSISGTPVKTWEQIRKQIRPNANQPLAFEVERSGVKRVVTITPAEAKAPSEKNPKVSEQVGQIGVTPAFKFTRESVPKAAVHAVTATGDYIVASIDGIGRIFSPKGISGVFNALQSSGVRKISSDQPIGLVGGARLAGQATTAGAFETLMQFLAGFIVFVGVINLAPLPPLDGGHLLVVAIEKVTSRKVDMRKVIPVAGAVLAFFVVLTVALVYLDIFRPVTNPFQ